MKVCAHKVTDNWARNHASDTEVIPGEQWVEARGPGLNPGSATDHL